MIETLLNPGGQEGQMCVDCLVLNEVFTYLSSPPTSNSPRRPVFLSPATQPQTPRVKTESLRVRHSDWHRVGT